MKYNLIFFIAFALLIACSNNKATEEKTISNSGEKNEVALATETTQPSGEGIVGYWKLTLEAYDDNGNKALDEEERKKGIKNKYTYRFNADGSCQIQDFYKGRYEEKTENGNKMLYVYRNRIVGEEDKDPVPDAYRITSMNKNQIVLLEQQGNLTFWVFERAG
jgi:hypothetical protein